MPGAFVSGFARGIHPLAHGTSPCAVGSECLHFSCAQRFGVHTERARDPYRTMQRRHCWSTGLPLFHTSTNVDATRCSHALVRLRGIPEPPCPCECRYVGHTDS
eukprot:scaffold27676_cov126-Isochrysis_galbana.AAC.3